MRSESGFVAAAAALAFACAAAAAGTIPLESHTNRFGVRFEYSLTEERLAASPAYDPAEDDPPLAVPRAVQVALSWLGENASLDLDELTLGSVRISRVPSEPRKWFYTVDFVEGWGDIERHSSRIVVVLMDGTVVEPDVTRPGSGR